MQSYVLREPSFDKLAKWEKEALIHPLLEAIKDFYHDENNRKAYEEWLSLKQAFFALEMEQEIRWDTA